MTTRYAKHVSVKQTPQSQPIPGTNQVANSAGGFSYELDDWKKFDRFLILGCESGSFYASEQKMTQDNAKVVQKCIASDPARAVDRIVEISEAGRAAKNTPAIFALALAISSDNPEAKQRAKAAVSKVCRIGTHIFQFNEAVKSLRGRGSVVNTAIRNWYLDKEPKDLAYQVVKYQQREGWSHRDLLRLCRPKAEGSRQDIFHWIVKGWDNVGNDPHPNTDLQVIWAMEKAKRSTSKEEIVRLIRDYNLVRECIPTQYLTEASVWEALLEKMPLTAMLRNLATMTRVGLIAPMSKAVAKVVDELTNKERLKKSRIHPIAVLSALKTYASGHGVKGGNNWTPVPQVTDALDGAFYLSFDNVTPTGKRWYLGIDVSGSMWGATLSGVSGLTAGYGAAAMALVTANTEANWYMAAFNTQMVPFGYSPKTRLDDLARAMAAIPWGGTDCSLPMLDAMQKKIPVDVFVVYTDSETWAGNIHPTQALAQYRNKMGIDAKLIVVGMCSNEFTIADPNDSRMLDVVGFSTDTPAVMSEFALGNI